MPASYRLFQPYHRDVQPLFSPPIKLALRRARIAAVAICGLNATIHTMNNELSTLVPADHPAGINGLLFGREVATGSLCAAAFYIPAALRIVNNVVRRTCHNTYPL